MSHADTSLGEARVRALKVPDPAFLVGRLKARKEALILSGASHEKLVGEEFVLVNEILKEDEPARAFARVSFTEDPKTINRIEDLGGRRAGVDPLMLREFGEREAPFHILKLKLLKAFASPKKLPRVPPGRFSSFIEFTETELDEAFHLRNVHWVPVPEDGKCPAAYPTKLEFPGTDTLRCFSTSAARVVRARESDVEIAEQERPPLKTQTYILSKERFETQGDANKWMDDNDAPRPKVDETETSFRYRQFPPDRCQEGTARTVRITDGVQIVGCQLKPEFREAITLFKDLPLVDRSREWDADEAKRRVRAWATEDDEIDFDRYSRAFVVIDGPEENLTSYKLPFADFIDGRLRAVPRGIFAAAAVLQGARGGVDLPPGDLTRARNHLGRYYSKMDLRAPWEPKESLSEQVAKLTNERARLRAAREDNPTERCGFCTYFQKPDVCKIIEGPVAADQVCDWIFSRGIKTDLYEISDDDWLAFVRGMIDKQPYQHIVRDGAITPAGPLVMIEDTAKPSHKFSLTKKFHVEHSSLEHSWTQEEVDALVKVGEDMDESSTFSEQERGVILEALQKGRALLSRKEHERVMEASAVWHHGPNGRATPAVWKSIVGDEVWYVTNTHRAVATTRTLEAAIQKYHGFIKSTA